MRVPALIATLVLLIPASAAENRGTITVHADKLNNNKGVLRVALFSTQEAYRADRGTADGAFRKEAGKIDNFQSACSFVDVPYGEYAIKLYHDEDNSGKFKKNMLGVPCVQFGFSNNAKAIFGPPDFKKCKFNFATSELKMDIHMDQR